MTKITTKTGRTLIATATGSAATGYYPVLIARNGRRVWEGAPMAHREPAAERAVAQARSME
jgi:hypothetical protein